MKLQGDYTFPAPREVVWRALNDPEVLARTLPGCERLAAAGENRFEGALNVRVGPVSGLFQGTVQLSDLEPLEGYHLALDGKGAPGFLQGKGHVRLRDGEAGETVLSYDLDAQVGGRIAGVGQRLLDSSAKVITRQALEGLEAQIAALPSASGEPAAEEASAVGETAEEGGEPAPARPAPQAPPPPSQAGFAFKFARGLFEEMVPAPWRPVVIGGGLALLALVVVLLVRACTG